MDRRTLLRILAVAGLAGCTPTTPTTPTRPAPTAAPTPHQPEPTGAPTAGATRPPGTASPSPAGPPPSPTLAPHVRTAISRELLGLPAPAPGGRAHAISGLMLHHTAAPTVPAAQAPERFRSHARSHQDAGFADIAYHWGVDVGGNVYQLRDERRAGETFTDYDPAGWFLVVCEGNFQEAEPTEAMLAAVADVLAAGAGRHDVAPSTLVGHRDVAATACPGDHLQARLDDLVGMVEQRLASGGVVLELTDDPAALP